MTDVKECPCPTITYPNGGEDIVARSISVSWYRPDLHGDEPNDEVWYELFFTDSYEPNTQNAWVQIATSPSNANSFTWNIPFSIKSDDCRIGIRCRNYQGATSEMSVSSGNFSIAKRKMSPPALARPLPGEVYRQSLPIVFDHSAIRGTSSQRSFYQIAYSSESLGIDWTVVADNISIDTKQLVIDTSDWLPSSDYSVRALLIDDDGSSSSPFISRGITISPLPYFILDSKPPTGSLSIQGNKEYITDRNVAISFSAIDEATEVQLVSVSEASAGEEDATEESAKFSNILTWRLTPNDGTKTIQAAFIDAGGNSSADGSNIPLIPYYSDSNQPIDSLYVGTDEIPYFVVGGTSDEFVESKSPRASTPGEVTAMSLYGTAFYFGILSTDNKGTLYREATEGTITSVQAFTTTDSRITALEEYAGSLYIGLQTGEIYRYDGTSMALVSTRSNTITHMMSDENNLYVFIDNESQIEIYDGTTFTNASVANASV